MIGFSADQAVGLAVILLVVLIMIVFFVVWIVAATQLRKLRR